jgi:hypothetical protein
MTALSALKFTAARLAIAASVLLMLTAAASAQTQPRPRPQMRTNDASSYRYAWEHGYRAGYEDGFEQGKRDFTDRQPRDLTRYDEYQRADRTYESRMGDLREYQDGYQAGFEISYNDGYFGRPYSVSIPRNLGEIVITSSPAAARSRTTDRSRDDDRNTQRDNRSYEDSRRNDRSGSRPDITVTDGVTMTIRLTSPISTKTNRAGDEFTAIVVDSRDYQEATVVGHIASIKHSGRTTGKTEMSLAFDSITLKDGRRGIMDAQVERIYESEKVKTVDEEGNVQTGNRTNDTVTRGAGGAAVGAIIGAIAGGGKGAAIGAIVGGAAGAGSVYVQGSKDLILEPGTELLIRTIGPRSR